MRRWLFIVLACAIALVVAPAAPVAPVERAWAIGDYAIDELSTQLTVQTNASAHVIERQTLTFSDVNAGVVWYLHAPESGESVRIASVRVAPVDDGGTLLGDWTRLQMIDSDPDRQGRAPGDTAAATLRATKTQPWYSYNIGDGMMRCYFPTGEMANKANKESRSTEGDAEGDGEARDEDAGTTDSDSDADEGSEGENAEGGASAGGAGDDFRTYIIETDYTVAHRVRVFRDIGELYWRYAHDNLPGDARNVSLQVVLPVPDGTDPATVVDSVRAWGHGPDEGTFAIGESGTVTYEVSNVPRGNYAEAHVIFPAAWLVDVAPGSANQFSELRGPAAIAEESGWVDIGLREAAWDNKVRLVFLGVALVIVLLGAVGALRRGRTPLGRRALVRTAATLGIVALGEHLFFREPLTTALLGGLALAALAVSLALPAEGRAGEAGAAGASGASGAAGEGRASEVGTAAEGRAEGADGAEYAGEDELVEVGYEGDDFGASGASAVSGASVASGASAASATSDEGVS